MQQEKLVEVQGKTYKVKYLMTSEAIRIEFKLAKLLVPTLGNAVGKMFSGIGDVESASTGFMDRELSLDSALEFLAAHAEEEETMAIIQKLFGCVTDANGVALPFETAFMGITLHLFKLLKEVLLHNYADFFGVLGGFVKKAFSQTEQVSASTPASAGSSQKSGASSSRASQR